jgi:hypothetical protein
MAQDRKRDPLSIFLALSMALLGLMYFQDWAGQNALDAHAASIGPLTQIEAISSCEISPVGNQGDEALIACPGKSAQQTREAAKELGAKAPASFKRFSFRGPQLTLRCGRDLTQCTEHPAKPRSFYQEARRKRPRTERSSPGG